MRKLTVTIGLAAASLATIGGLTACGGGHPATPRVGQAAPGYGTSAPVSGPAGVLQSDGYSVVMDLDHSHLVSMMGLPSDSKSDVQLAGSMFDTGAVGTHGSREEVVLKLTAGGKTFFSIPSVMKSFEQGVGHGAKAHEAGNYIVLDGSASSFDS